MLFSQVEIALNSHCICPLYSEPAILKDGFQQWSDWYYQRVTRCGCLSRTFYQNICDKKDSVRVKKMDRKSTESEKIKRKKRHAKRKGFADIHAEKEGVTYEAGKF